MGGAGEAAARLLAASQSTGMGSSACVGLLNFGCVVFGCLMCRVKGCSRLTDRGPVGFRVLNYPGHGFTNNVTHPHSSHVQ